MNPITQFREWLDAVVGRLRRKAAARGFAALAVVALVATIALAAYSNRMAFSEQSLFWSRLVLVVVLGLAAAFALIVPLLSINRRRVLRDVEKRFPQFEQRAMTVADAPESNPFVQLLAAETLRAAEEVPPQRLASPAALWGMSAAGVAGAAALLWLTMGAPGPLGHGASLLWAGTGRTGTQDYYRIDIEPGDRKVRRGSDQAVSARLIGFDAQPVLLRARTAGAAKWDELVMERNPGGDGYSFLLAGLNESIEYQVMSGRVRSGVHKLTVVDLPAVKRIRVTYRFPAWAGTKNLVEDPGGDLRAVEGTEADLQVTTDKPAANALLVFDDGTKLPLRSAEESRLAASVSIRKDGSYYVAAMDGEDEVRISDDYFVEAMKETPPVVKIAKPGRDARVSPIEEVKVEVSATDDFALEQMELRYSVNGGEEKAVTLLPRKGVKEASARHLIPLEDFKLEPGDILAMYAQARDAKNTTRTDVYFLEAQPYEREYSQSQVSGGGGEGGQREAQISQRQKEIIAATWNEVRGMKSQAAQREDAKFLADVQEKLSMQARSLANRMKSRQLAGANDEFTKFVKEMEAASVAMTEAVSRLKTMRWKEALPSEQRALQHILRGEAIFKQIQVAFGQQQGGGGMGGGENRDLESLFDLELDTEKNQYEASDSAQSSNRDAAVDEALKKLEELAKRQQQLAQQQQNKQQQFQQRWQQEMLRREAEELRRRMEEMAQSQQQQGQQSAQQSQQQQGSPSAQGQQSRSLRQMASGSASGDPRVQRAKEQLEKALEDMRRATQGGGDPSSARRAAERMEEANAQLGSMRRQETTGKMDELAQRSDKLAERQRRFEKELKNSVGGQRPGQPTLEDKPGPTKETNDRLAAEKDQIAKEYEKLERDLQSATRAMAGSRRQTSSKLREALGEAQQKELGLRLKFATEWLKKGLGAHLAPRERVVTDALNRLSEQVDEAKKSAGGEAGDGKREQAERALESFERARAQLGQSVQGQPGQSRQGQQSSGEGRSKEGKQGEAGQEGKGSERNESPGSTSGSRDYSATNDGTRQSGMSGEGKSPENRGRGAEQAWSDMVRELRTLREATPAEDESRKEIDDVIKRMQQLDPKRFPGNPALLEALRLSVMPELEQLELRLRMQAGGGEAGPVRAGKESKAPAGYEKAVAEYYRRLSQGK